MRLLVLAAVALMGGDPGAQTISGTISANSGSSITVASANRSLTCAVADKGALVILKWGTGVRVGMACKKVQGRFVLSRLTRLGTKEPQRPDTTTKPTETTTRPTEPTRPTTTTTTTTEPTRPASPTAPTQQRREAIGTVLVLHSDGVALKPNNGGEVFTCAITQASDSQQAAAKLTLGARAGIVCRLDGTRYVLAGATPIK